MSKNDRDSLIEGARIPEVTERGGDGGHADTSVEGAQVEVLTGLNAVAFSGVVESADRPFNRMRDLVEGVEGVENHPRLPEVADFFDNMIVEMGLQDGAFLKSPELLVYFQERLKVFLISLDNNIKELKHNIDTLGTSLVLYHLPNNWEEVLKKACYTAFFVHFGQKRAGEKDQSGETQDYICHPMRVLFKHTINKQHEFSLRRWIIAVLHDTREDVHKGFLRVMMLEGENLSVGVLDGKQKQDEAKQRAEEAVGILRRQEEGLQNEYSGAVRAKCPHTSPRLLEHELTVSEGLDILTNDTGDRGKGILHMFRKAFDLADVGGKDRLLSAFGDILQIKNAGDRVDNVRTSGIKGSALKVQAETLHIFCRLCQEFGMLNIADWHFDYLYAVGHPEEYREIMQLRRDADHKRGDVDEDDEFLPATEAFKKEFLSRMREKLQIPDLKFGKDFTLIFRPVGQRFRGLKESRADLTRDDASKDLRNYVIFYPMGGSTLFAESARQVFREMTEDGFNDDIYYEEPDKTALGREIVDVSGPMQPVERRGAVGSSADYGTVVWRCFKSEEAAAFSLLGYHYVLEKYGFAPASRALKLGLHGREDLSLNDLRMKFKEFTAGLQEVLGGLEDDYSRVGEFLHTKDEAFRARFYDYMHQKVMTMFLKRRDVSVSISMDGSFQKCEVSVPVKLYASCRSSQDYESLLVYARPELMGRVHFTSERNGRLNFTVGQDFIEQASSREMALLQVTLTGEKNKLLFEEFPQ